METTAFDVMTYCDRLNWRKHGPFKGYSSEDDYIRKRLENMSIDDVLKEFALAIEEVRRADTLPASN